MMGDAAAASSSDASKQPDENSRPAAGTDPGLTDAEKKAIAKSSVVNYRTRRLTDGHCLTSILPGGSMPPIVGNMSAARGGVAANARRKHSICIPPQAPQQQPPPPPPCPSQGQVEQGSSSSMSGIASSVQPAADSDCWAPLAPNWGRVPNFISAPSALGAWLTYDRWLSPPPEFTPVPHLTDPSDGWATPASGSCATVTANFGSTKVAGDEEQDSDEYGAVVQAVLSNLDLSPAKEATGTEQQPALQGFQSGEFKPVEEGSMREIQEGTLAPDLTVQAHGAALGAVKNAGQLLDEASAWMFHITSERQNEKNTLLHAALERFGQAMTDASRTLREELDRIGA